MIALQATKPMSTSVWLTVAFVFADAVAASAAPAVESESMGGAQDTIEKARAEIRGAVLAASSSIHSFSLDCEEFVLTARDERDDTKAFQRIRFAVSSDGRSALRRVLVRPNGSQQVMEDVRQDGKRMYSVREVPDNSGRVDLEVIRAQDGPIERYRGSMFSVLWLTLPAGETLGSHLARGDAQLEVAREAKNTLSARVSIERSSPAARVTCFLDSSRDWIVDRLEFGDKPIEIIQVTAFGRTEGRYFPKSGTIVDHRGGRTLRRGFEVSNLSINEPLSMERFQGPSLQDGAALVDSVKGTSQVVGGPRARERLLREIDRMSRKPESPRTAPSVRAPSSPGEFPWGIVLVSIGGFAFATALLLHIRRRRS